MRESSNDGIEYGDGTDEYRHSSNGKHISTAHFNQYPSKINQYEKDAF